MKRSIYERLEDIPQGDRDENNYQLCSDAGSPNNGKWILLLDGAHPVQMKNTELLSEKAGTVKKSEHDAAIAAKDTEITRLSSELQTTKTQLGLPAGQVAVLAADAALLTQIKQLGEFDDIKKKIDEYPTLKEKEESATRKTLLKAAAQAHGINPDAFISLAELHKLAEKLDKREIDDGKSKGDKVTHFFVKGKDENGGDTTVVLSDFIKTDVNFKPFLTSLTATADKTNKVKIPGQGAGDIVAEKGAGRAYISSKYKTPAKKAEAETYSAEPNI
jgi:hypothetical protein